LIYFEKSDFVKQDKLRWSWSWSTLLGSVSLQGSVVAIIQKKKTGKLGNNPLWGQLTGQKF